MKNLVKKYLGILNTQNLSMATIKLAESSMEEFINFLFFQRNKKDVREITVEDMENYALYVLKRKNRGTLKNTGITVKNRLLHRARDFTKWLTENEYIMTDAGKDIDYLKTSKTVPRDILTQREIKKFFEVIPDRFPAQQRDSCLFRLFYHTGIRKGEAERIRLCDINLNDSVLLVNGKGMKKRLVPLGPSISRIVDQYLGHTWPLLVRNNPAQELVFVTEKGRSFSKNIINNICRTYTKKAGIKKNITAHSFRHTFATHLVNNGASIRHVQEILGHEYLQTTTIYTRVSIKNLKEVFDRCHPRAIEKSLDNTVTGNILKADSDKKPFKPKE